MPTYAITNTFADGNVLTGAQLNANFNDIKTFVNTTKLDADNIAALSITNALVATAAAIAVSKLAAGTANQVLINNATPTPAWTDLSGDVTNVLGVMSIGAGKVTNAMLAGSITEAKITAGTLTTASLSATAGITSGQMALASGKINIGSAGGVAAAMTPSGDWTITAAGVSTIANSAVTTAKINDNAVTSRKLSATQGIARASSASQGLTTTAADVAGLVTSAITPSVNCTVAVRVNLLVGGATSTRDFLGDVLESSDNGGTYPTALGTTYGAVMQHQMAADQSRAVVSAEFQRSLTAGTTYKWKVQGASTTSNTGNVYQALSTSIAWEIIS